jgi:hypothetical protein
MQYNAAPVVTEEECQMTSTHRIVGRIAAWTAVATLGVVAIAGVALADPTTTTSPGPTASTQARPAGKPHVRGDQRNGRVGRLGKKAVRGEFVVKGKDGKFVTVLSQRGLVTAVDPASITLKSADGFTASYTLTSATKVRRAGAAATIGDVKVGDPALVMATKSGGRKTARGVVVRPVKGKGQHD